MLHNDPHGGARALDQAWDAMIAARPLPTTDVDPGLIATVQRLHALDAAVQPVPSFVDRLEARLLPAASLSLQPPVAVFPPAMLPSPPRRNDTAPAPRRRPRWRRAAGRAWPMLELAAAILLLLLIGGYFASSKILTRSISAPPGSAVALYASAPFEGTDPLKQQLTPLDPTTLADLPGKPAISLADPKANPTWAEWATADPSIAFAASADGSTIAQIEPVWTGAPPVGPDTTVVRGAGSANAVTIVIRDGRTGAIRQRIAVAGRVEYPILNQDGTRVIVRSPNGQFWVAYDTASGRQFPLVNLGTDYPESAAVNPAGTRLYVMLRHGSTTPYPPPAKLDVYDLTLGRDLASATFEYIPAGWATYGKDQQGLPIQRDFVPGLAVSPDGKTLAIAHAEADSDAITLLDATTLKETRTFTPAAPKSLVDRVLAWLPLAPQSAAAKGEEDVLGRHPVFSADGRMLYVVGPWFGVSQYQDFQPYGNGLEAIDLATGTVTGALPDSLTVTTLLPAPNGKTLYVVGFKPTEVGYHLQRLDGTTLGTQAVRGFTDLGSRWFVLMQ